jgi:hypothetical protein
MLQTVLADELLLNGAFEDSLNGWSYTYSGGSSACNTGYYDPDPDKEAYLYQYDASYGMLSQTVNSGNAWVNFSAQLALQAVETNPAVTYWAVGALAISYLSANDSVLGRTLIACTTAHSPLVSSSTLHLITVADTLWHTYAFNLQTELANLPGVNPAQVRKLRIALFDTTNGC